jgi:exosortase/archaeosortase family protein
MAIFFICTAYGYVLFRRSWRWLAMIVAALPLAVIGNTFRLLVVLFIAAHWGKERGEWAHDNTYISLLPYVPAILGVVYLARWLEPKSSAPASEVAP